MVTAGRGNARIDRSIDRSIDFEIVVPSQQVRIRKLWYSAAKLTLVDAGGGFKLPAPRFYGRPFYLFFR
jgi:hypothetical protein